MVVMPGIGPVFQRCGVRVAPLPGDHSEAQGEYGERRSQPDCNWSSGVLHWVPSRVAFRQRRKVQVGRDEAP